MLRINNECIHATCPECGGKMELYRYYGIDDQEVEYFPPNYWQCHNCGYMEDEK